jgi:hypothetical protein
MMMLRIRNAFVAAALALALSACAGMTRYDAAGDVHAFLVSIRDGDKAAFDAHVDRPALKAQIKARFLAATAKSHGGGSWAALGAALIRPLVEYLGYSENTPIPNRVEIAGALRQLDGDRVCVVRKKGGPCVLIFKLEDGTWRLIGFEGDPALLRAPGTPRS